MARIVFDLDGTLVESVPGIAVAVNTLLETIGRKPLSRDTVAGVVGKGIPRLVERSLEYSGGIPDGEFESLLMRYRSIYDADPVAGSQVYPGVPEILNRLQALGHGLSVCTQKTDAAAYKMLTELELMPPVTGLTGGSALKVLKPDPQMFWHAADQLPAGRAIMVGDSETDAQTASAAGVPFLFFTGGYCHVPLDQIVTAGKFDRFCELPELIEKLTDESTAA